MQFAGEILFGAATQAAMPILPSTTKNPKPFICALHSLYIYYQLVILLR